MADEPTFTIVYEQQEPRPNLPVGGMVGSITPDGASVVAHVYVEHATLPSIEQYPVEDGVIDLSKKPTVVKTSTVTRKLVATLVFSPELADRCGKWLVTKSKQATQVSKQHRKRGNKK